MEALKLGVLARDKVSGFEGIVMARTEWAYGCTRIGLYPRVTNEDGDVKDDQWFDERQVEQIGVGISEEPWVESFEVYGNEADAEPETVTSAPLRKAGTGGPSRPAGIRSKETG